MPSLFVQRHRSWVLSGGPFVFAKEEVERELNGVSDNPLIFHGSDDTTDAVHRCMD